MMKYGLKIWIIGWMIIFSSVYGYANEAKGYKIVLTSFATFDEAKAKLASLDGELGEGERALWEKYHFEIVARASGKAFIVGIEPLETKAVTDEVMKQFKHLYPNAYSNGYFGPTEGSVFFKHTPTVSAVKDVNRSIPQKVEMPAEAKSIKAVNVPKKDEEKAPLLWMVIVGLIVLMLAAFVGFKRRTPPKEELFIESDIEIVDVKSSEEIVSEEVEESVRVETPLARVEPVDKDIFYRLKKNIFFITLLKELKEAADSKDASRCRDLTDEVLRYQKNFRQSDVITTIEKLVETKEFSQLSTFINRELN